jgi:hypothetical protein
MEQAMTCHPVWNGKKYLHGAEANAFRSHQARLIVEQAHEAAIRRERMDQRQRARGGRRYFALIAFVVIACTILIWAGMALGQTLPTTQPTVPATQPAKPKFVVGVYKQPRESFDKWKSLGINTLYEWEPNDCTKQQFEDAATNRGLFFINAPGANIGSEVKQPFRLGFQQPDEADLSNHVGLAGSTLPELAERYRRVKLSGGKVYSNFAGNAFDNEFYDGMPKPSKLDASKWGHRASVGGYFAQGDTLSYDYYLWGTKRPGMFFITDRCSLRLWEWSGGKPVLLFIEASNQGANVPFGVPEFRANLYHQLAFALTNGIRVEGVVFWTHKTVPNWAGYDNTTPEIKSEIKIFAESAQAWLDGRVLPVPTPAASLPATLPTTVPSPPTPCACSCMQK